MQSTVRIKKKNLNEYLLTGDDIWVRNPYKAGKSLDINKLSSKEDYHLYLRNETYNAKLSWPNIDSEKIFKKNVVVVSDGYNFADKQKILAKFPFKEVTIIGTNRALANWNMIRGDIKRAMDYFVVNNPYEECLKYLPTEHRYYPNCICSLRTNPEFVRKYRGNIYFYSPTCDATYSSKARGYLYTIDDYRNPICAAINLSVRFGVKKLLLFCCDDSFNSERPAAVQLENNLWCYPQQIMSHEIIDGCLFWLKRQGVLIKDHSSGPKYENASYISEEDIEEFFKE